MRRIRRLLSVGLRVPAVDDVACVQDGNGVRPNPTRISSPA